MLCAGLGGCAELQNTQIAAADVDPSLPPADGDPQIHGGRYPGQYSFDAWVRTRRQMLHENAIPDPAIVISLSGGFVHAAALSNYVLEELKAYRVPGCSPLVRVDPQTVCTDHSLIDHLVLITSTSGGGFASANLVVNGPEGLERFDATFDRSALGLNLLADALLRVPGWPTLFGPFGDRSPYLMHVVDDEILHRVPIDPGNPAAGERLRTFGDLSPLRPFVIFGATDYAAERHFNFTQDSFNDICSDLSKLPLSTAVTASGSFPILLTDTELANYWARGTTPCPLPVVTRERFKRALALDGPNRYVDKQLYLDDRYSDSLRRSIAPDAASAPGSSADGGPDDMPPFRPETILHLFDGGLSDNLAARPLAKLLTADNLTKWFAGRRILYLQVDARTDASTGYESSRGSPNLFALSTGTSYAAIDSDTSLSAYTLSTYWRRIFRDFDPKKQPTPTAMYMAEVDFDDIYQVRLQQHVKKIGTGFAITPLSNDDLDLLHFTAAMLMDQHPCFTRFLADAGIPLRPLAADVAVPGGVAITPVPSDKCGVLIPGAPNTNDSIYDPTVPQGARIRKQFF